MWLRPKERIAATMVARPFVEYHAATRTGCSDRRYHCAVRREKRGRQPASKRPSRARDTIKPPKLSRTSVSAHGSNGCMSPQRK